MYIYKNQCGIKLSVEEFIEAIDQDVIDELISVIICLDDSTILDEFMESNDGIVCEDSENSRVSRIFNKFKSNLEGTL